MVLMEIKSVNHTQAVFMGLGRLPLSLGSNSLCLYDQYRAALTSQALAVVAFDSESSAEAS